MLRHMSLNCHLFNMNIDLAGQSLGGTVIGVTGDSSICRQFEALAEKCGIGMATRSSVWSSDSNTFAWKRVPSMTLNRDGYGMHTEYDTIDLSNLCLVTSPQCTASLHYSRLFGK